MKEGDYFAVGNPCSLYCRCEKIYEDGSIHGLVINGAWSFHYAPHNRKMRWDSPTGPDEALADISYLGPWPNSFNGYNDAIAFVDAQLKKPKIVRWGQEKLWLTQALIRRFKKALRAFQDSWQGKKPDPNDFSPSIPF
jgi:hypothetical protein